MAKGGCSFVLCWTGAALVLIAGGVSSVSIRSVQLLTEFNRTDYVLQGESATLHCNYFISQDEVVKSVRWEKDETEVYVWRPGRRPIAKHVLIGRADLTNQEPAQIAIRHADMELQGTYNCTVQTNQNTAHNDMYLTVIVDACKDDIWETHLNTTTCTESIKMKCVGIFPKPSPSCGIYNEATKKFLTSVPFDRVLQLRNKTYDVSLNKRYNIRNWSNYSEVTFHCHFVILGTSWRRGIHHRLFGDPGCPPEPPDVGPGSYNMTDELSCYGRPRSGATVTYFCDKGYKLKGPRKLVCRKGSWVPEEVVSDARPRCNTAPKTNVFSLANLSIGTIFSFAIRRNTV